MSLNLAALRSPDLVLKAFVVIAVVIKWYQFLLGMS